MKREKVTPGAAMIPILVTLAVLLLVCIGCVVFVPFHLSLAGGYAGGFTGLLRIGWLWGALKIERILDERETSVYLLGMRSARFTGTGRTRKKENRRVRPRAKRRRSAGAMLSNIPEAARLFGKIVRSLSPRGAVRAVFGLGDPAETGIVFGAASAFRALVPVHVQLTPDFGRRIITANGMLSIRICVAGLLAIGIGEFLSPPGRKLLRSMR